MLRFKPAMLIATAFLAVAFARPEQAHAIAEITLRAGGDVRPVIGFGPGGLFTFNDGGALGLHIAPGLELLEVLTVELDVVSLIGISGAAQGFDLLLAPGARFDLALAYARLSLPMTFTNGFGFFYEAAAGISFMQYAYAGVQASYIPDPGGRKGYSMLGLEAGINIDLMGL